MEKPRHLNLAFTCKIYFLISMISKTEQKGDTIRLNYTDQGQKGLAQCAGQGVYCGLRTASEVILIFTTSPYSLFLLMKCTRHLQEGSNATGILTPHILSPSCYFKWLAILQKDHCHVL